MVFDWSADAGPPAIRWAAFYSDCEHEVLEVRSGHRVTLTYNLYAVCGSGHLTGHCPTLQPSLLPLFSRMQALLNEPRFMEDGKFAAQ